MAWLQALIFTKFSLGSPESVTKASLALQQKVVDVLGSGTSAGPALYANAAEPAS